MSLAHLDVIRSGDSCLVFEFYLYLQFRARSGVVAITILEPPVGHNHEDFVAVLSN